MSDVRSMLRDGRFGDLNAWLVRGFPGPSVGPFSVTLWQDGQLTALSTAESSTSVAFPLGCLQDAMVGALFCALADEGALSLDDPIAKHCPELSSAASGEEAPRLTHLLSHSTGLWADRPAATDEPPLEFEAFCQLLVPRWAAGNISAHSLLDRILLLKVAERATGRPAYDELRDRFALSSRSLTFRPPDGSLARCYSELYGSLEDCAAFLDAATRTSWPARIGAGMMAPITQAAQVRPWAPVADGLGLFRLGNGILGQDGDHPTRGYAGLRLSRSCRTAVFGHFRSSVARDHMLNRLVSDVMDVALPDRSPILGHLNGFAPSALAGDYDGIWGSQRHIGVAGGQLAITAARELRALAADIQADGTLTGRWAAPNLWIEPQSLGADDLVGFRFGKHLHVKDIRYGHS